MNDRDATDASAPIPDQAQDQAHDHDHDQAAIVGPQAHRRRALLLRILGLVIVVAAVTLCARALVSQWAEVSAALRTADLRWIFASVIAAAAGMWFLALLWYRCLRVFGADVPVNRTTAWFFAGELGKYLPGGIWPVVGRGEFAHRGGVGRSVAYATVLISLGVMCVGGAMACVLFVPFMIGDGLNMRWELLILPLVPVGIALVHPAIFSKILQLVNKVSKGRISLDAPAWGKMIGLIAVSTPAWLLVGAAAAMVTHGLGFEQQPARVAFAAVSAWIIGFLILPVPAGAGVRELIFLLVSGLAGGPAVAVAAVSRLTYILVDAVAGVTGLLIMKATNSASPSAASPSAESPSAESPSADSTDRSVVLGGDQ